MEPRSLRFAIGGIAFAVAMFVGVSSSSAATINVTTTIDEFESGNRCSLREAIWSANNDSIDSAPGCRAGSGKDKVIVPSGSFFLKRKNRAPEPLEGELIGEVPEFENLGETGDLDLTTPVTVIHTGSNLATIDSRVNNERVFHVLADGVVIQGLTITGGNATDSVDDHGGGILNEGGLTLRSSTLTRNIGVYGGGLSTAGTSETIVSNTTISANEAFEDGGGVSVETGGTVSLRSTTVADNLADSDRSGGGDGGGVFASTSADGGVLELRNSIVAANADDGREANDCAKLGGTITSLGRNLLSNSNGCDYEQGQDDIINRKAEMLPLRYNGGPSQTHALKTISPAVGTAGGCPPADQRGVTRTGKCDIGAWELEYCQGAVINRIGSDASDLLSGTSSRDGILGLGGQDTLRGLGGNDGLCGGKGPDVLEGGAGNDVLDGGAGKDECIGGGGRTRTVKCELPKKKKKKGDQGRR